MSLDEYEIGRRHTAEHIFMKTLVDMLADTKVVKVVHEPEINKIILKSREISWDDVVKASIKTNMVIQEGRKVFIEYYKSIDEAKKRYPYIRAYESRISGNVRVVVIEGYDVSACKMPHVSNTRECIMFLPVSLSKVKGNLYEVEYYAGGDAILNAVKYTGRLIDILRRFNTEFDNIKKVIDNMLQEHTYLKTSIKELTKAIIEGIRVVEGKYKYIYVDYPYLNMDIAGRVLSKRNDYDVAFILSFDGQRYRFLLASDKYDLKNLFQRIIENGSGRGGGRGGWYMGYVIDSNAAKKVFMEFMENG